jgi:hypothetical protein
VIPVELVERVPVTGLGVLDVIKEESAAGGTALGLRALQPMRRPLDDLITCQIREVATSMT